MKKKVCILRSGDITFISRIHRTALALQESNNYDVTTLSITPRDNIKRGDYAYKMSYVDIRSRVFKSSIFSGLRILEGLTKLFYKALKQRADIYIAIGVEDLVIVYLVSKFTRAKFVYSANELEGDRKRVANKKLNTRLNSIVIRTERFMLKSAKCVIAADIERAKLMEDWYKLDKVEVVRNVPIPERISESNLIREKLGIPEEQKVLLYQGMLSPGRGLEVAIKACSITQSVNFCLVLLGFISDTYQQKLLDLAKQENFERLYILPAVPWTELLYWTSSSDISIVLIENVSISYYLAAPNKLYESIMAGIPYIASDFPEINHVHKISKSGILVDPENIDEISQAISSLIQNESFYEECVQGALQARNILNWDVEKKKLLNIVGQVI
ncbi:MULTISPECIES: glycosyltransferase [Flavobacteriaceae]|uniref:glycosyltransferase n=1 Tax=Flavobacteriaceae TaxID=49546 RepID=UPI00234B20BB|nr:glycosyltransferase [Muricauda sp. SP22]MDC6362081.1 glycosyltransferase [Muricauda sp. SP22]